MVSVLDMLGSPLGQILGKPLGYNPPSEPMGTAADFLGKFPGMARMTSRLDSRSFLDSRSSSPVDSETSGFSSGSDHLSDLLVSVCTLGGGGLCVSGFELMYVKCMSM